MSYFQKGIPVITSYRRPICLSFVACLAFLFLPAVTSADVALPKIFGDEMVLQRDKPLTIWGTADANEKVTVTIGDSSKTTSAGQNGKWSVELPSLPASKKPVPFTVQGNNKISLKNVLIGDVWICSGQSNMEWSVDRGKNPQQEIAAADHPQIRLFTVKRHKADAPVDDVTGSWAICTPASIPKFSAVGYFFGRYLQKHLDVPIGLINSSWGGTPAEYWTPKSSFENDPQLKQTSDHPHAQNVMTTPSVLYNGMIAPLAPLTIRGAIWYQGESNVPMARHYAKMFGAMITGWRREFGQGDFPFLFVQIAPWNYAGIKSWPRSGAPEVREAQLQTLALPNTGMVVTTDIGNVKDIHPKNKQEVGRRLGLAARAVAFGENIVASGPIFREMKIDGDRAILSFDHVGGGLLARGETLSHFQVAGKDKKFVDAQAKIQGDKVIVWSDAVSEPVAVRFGFSDIAEPNLFNKEGLPASPFRTD